MTISRIFNKRASNGINKLKIAGKKKHAVPCAPNKTNTKNNFPKLNTDSFITGKNISNIVNTANCRV